MESSYGVGWSVQADPLSVSGRPAGTFPERDLWRHLPGRTATQYIRSMSSWEMGRAQLGPVQTVVVWTGHSFVSSYVLIRREGIGVTKTVLPVAAV